MRNAESRLEVLTPLLGALPNCDHQSSRRDLPPEERAVPSLIRSYFDSHGWDFILSVVTRRGCLCDAVTKLAGTAASALPDTPTRVRAWSPS